MTTRACGTCRHWLTDEWGADGACGIRAATWAAHWRTEHGYGPGVPETVMWTVTHMTDSDAPACKRWRAFEMEVDA